jgi:nitrite reductase (NADH) small subunit
MDAWVEVCALDDIPRRGARIVERGDAVPIALFRTGADQVFALLDRCPHRGGPLSQGLVAGDQVVCPLHGWTIELAGGGAVAPDEGCTQAYAVELRDGRVRLRADDLASVVPAEAGTQRLCAVTEAGTTLGPRLRGDDADASPARERQAFR